MTEEWVEVLVLSGVGVTCKSLARGFRSQNAESVPSGKFWLVGGGGEGVALQRRDTSQQSIGRWPWRLEARLATLWVQGRKCK